MPLRIPARRLACLALTLVALGPVSLRAQSPDPPIFDTHIHYSSGDWIEYPPERILGILDKAGVKRALVSSTPDDGTLTLYAKDPKRVVPILRPYRTRGDMGHWWQDPAVLAYVQEPNMAHTVAFAEGTYNPVTQMGNPECFKLFTKEELEAIQWDSLEEEMAGSVEYDIVPDYDKLLDIWNTAKKG